MSDSATAYGFELCVAVPQGLPGDIYTLHQLAWAQATRDQRFNWTPNTLFRRDGGLVRIRITDACAVRARPVRATLRRGAVLNLDVHLALWRSVQVQPCDPAVRARELIEAHGVTVRELDMRCGVARGYKAKIGADIRMPVARCLASITVEDPAALARAWSTGMGRGRRFGFGMPILH